MKILFVDHAFHRKTHSADFFLDILRESFEVEIFYYKQPYHFNIPQAKAEGADIVIFWEFLYSRKTLGIPGKRCVFVPMYDNEWGSRWQWQRIAASGMPVISFCDAITRHAKAQGVRNILDVRFAFNPADFDGMSGNPRKAALWERGQISLSNAESLFAPATIDKLTIFRRPEDRIDHKTIDKAKLPFDVDVNESAFLPQDEYRKLQKDFGVYIAPRYKEGIGMAFLEQLAMGKCVIAHDDATMNEYIENGKTGILRDFRKQIKPISAAEIEAVLSNVKASAQHAYERWLKDKATINPFIKTAAKLPPIKVGSTIDLAKYLLFLLEGGCYRLRTGLTNCNVGVRTIFTHAWPAKIITATNSVAGILRSWFRSRLYHFIGTIQEPWYTWFNALANAWIRFRSPERVSHPGNLHPDKTFYVIRNLSPYVGLAGQHDAAIGYMMRARKKGWIPVIDPQPPMQPDDGDWYAFFKGVSPYSVDEALQSKNVVFAVAQGMIHKRYNVKNIAERHRLAGEIQLSDELRSFIDGKMGILFESCKGPMVAIRYRGTDYRYANGHAKVPDVEWFCDTVEADMRKWGVDIGGGEHIFVATEEQEALDGIRRRFPKCRYVEKERFSNTGERKYLCCRRLRTLTPKMNNFMYMLEIHALARCDYLIGGVNGGVLMALNLNGNRYRGVHVINTGVN